MPRRPCRGRPGKESPGNEHGVCARLRDHVRAELRLRVSPIHPVPISLCALRCLNPAVPTPAPPKVPVGKPKRDANAGAAPDCGRANSEPRILHRSSGCPFPGRPRQGRRGTEPPGMDLRRPGKGHPEDLCSTRLTAAATRIVLLGRALVQPAVPVAVAEVHRRADSRPHREPDPGVLRQGEC